MFIGAGIRLDVGFNAAQARLTNLVRGGLLRRASGGAYDEWQAGLARVEPRAAALGMSELVQVRFRDRVSHGDSAVWAMRWEVTGPGGSLFPALDADIVLTPAGEDATMLAVSGAYRPPLGALGAGLDRAIMHRVAEATIRIFTNHIRTAIVHAVASPAAGTWRPDRLLSRRGIRQVVARSCECCAPSPVAAARGLELVILFLMSQIWLW